MSTVTICTLAMLFSGQQGDYVFLPMKFREANYYVRDDKCSMIMKGYINRFGLFVAEGTHWKADKTRKNPSTIENNGPRGGSRKSSDYIDIAALCINAEEYSKEPVYEFRSGMLIPGFFNSSYEFVPEAGGTIMEFNKYVYSRSSRRIYNLPGKFVKKSQLKEEQAKIAELESRKP